jgi:hypothetical protein
MMLAVLIVVVVPTMPIVVVVIVQVALAVKLDPPLSRAWTMPLFSS